MPRDDGVTAAFEILLDELSEEISDSREEIASYARSGTYQRAQNLISGAERLEAFKLKVAALSIEWESNSSEIPMRPNPSRAAEVRSSVSQIARAAKTLLVVKFEDGQIFSDKTAAETFAKCIIKVGINRVEALQLRVNFLPLVSNMRPDKYTAYEHSGYFISTQNSTAAKKDLLDRIFNSLNIAATVHIVPSA